MTTPIVIGIHGLLNKPPQETLGAWWERALREGLRRNHGVEPAPGFFRLAYWADVRNPAPVPDREQQEPYHEATGDGPLRRYEAGFADALRAVANKWGGRPIDKAKDLIGIGPGVEKLLATKLEDLGDYYGLDPIRATIRRRLSSLLREHRTGPILLVAHSMGSIIAHDVLRELESDPTVAIQHWITIGSPLGLPLVGKKIRDEFGAQRTPANVRRWTNLSDPGDKVALDCNLRDDFAPSPAGVRVEDHFVHNDYASPAGEPNNHKSYGYLRAPELCDGLSDFLRGGP